MTTEETRFQTVVGATHSHASVYAKACTGGRECPHAIQRATVKILLAALKKAVDGDKQYTPVLEALEEVVEVDTAPWSDLNMSVAWEAVAKAAEYSAEDWQLGKVM